MPTCQRCGSYYSEGSCPFCTPDDSPDSPVKTIEVEEVKQVRIIDPLDLIESIENVEKDLERLSEEKELEIKKLNEEIVKLEDSNNKIGIEIDEALSHISNLKSSLAEKEGIKKDLSQKKELLQSDISSLKTTLKEIENKINTYDSEMVELKSSLGGI
ncbi:MAG: hypothetical protein ACTSW1_03335 [Candidatus Hodarchaeales archaeon]